MGSIQQFEKTDIRPENPLFSSTKTLIETIFYGNNVELVPDLESAYYKAKKAPGTIVTDLPVKHADKLALPADAKMLVGNDGKIVGRTSAARVIIGQPGVNQKYYDALLREAMYQATKQKFYQGNVIVGLHEEFMIRSHVLVPEGFELNLYSYLLNFQIETAHWRTRYQHSKPLKENDIYLFANPEWTHPDFPHGLALFDPIHNVAAILGLRYFGELKKGTLTLAWATAHRNNFVACHGGLKQYQLTDRQFTMAAFGLSGSGKSTITLTKHRGRYHVDVLHDDAFVIHKETETTIALEPAYFDKVQDYPLTDSRVEYFLTMQNVGVTLDEQGRKVPVLEDIRNSNGRTVKSRFVTKNRVDVITEKIDAIFWIMKDDSLPPVVKIDDPVLAAVFGLTLATKRSTAENLVGEVDLEALVIEPYANPFRSYPLGEDYQNFRELFQKQATDCYILNTDAFNGKNIPAKVTLASIETIIEQPDAFVPFDSIDGLSYLPLDDFVVDFTQVTYLEKVQARMQNRLDFILKQNDFNRLPEEAAQAMENVIDSLKRMK
nr:phosphoenolpyruvate carboxykinase (ATP) [Enterococcus sp. DIV2402]MBO0463032.1 phosphoenolpyruvate carboxykinase (ATP) [Enterococcus sp. DIV2402]